MGERKVLNKYIPADFNPALVPRGKKLSTKDGTVPVRMMLPFSIQCSTCQTFLYRGRKFNSKKEAMKGPAGKYLGIQRWRFYIKCTHCSRPITFSTDPKNADYEMETGATRNYEVYKDKSGTEEKFSEEKEKQEKIDPMRALENRVLDSQREMADFDNLEQIKAMNLKHVQFQNHIMNTNKIGINDGIHAFDTDARTVLDTIHGKEKDSNNSNNNKRRITQSNDNIQSGGNGGGSNNHKNVELLTEEDENLIKSIKFGRGGSSKTNKNKQEYSQATSMIKRLDEEDEKRVDEQRRIEADRLLSSNSSMQTKNDDNKNQRDSNNGNALRIFPNVKIKKRRRIQPKKIPNNAATKKMTDDITVTTTRPVISKEASKPTVTKPTNANSGLSSLLGGYSSSSDSE